MNAIEPELVLCSSARRTRETLEGVAPAGHRMIESELYSATAGDLVARLRRVPDDVASVMLIGHNSGGADARAATRPPRRRRRR